MLATSNMLVTTNMLASSTMLADIDYVGDNEHVDTLAVARRKHPGASNSLDALCKRYGVDTSQRTKHGAIIDCILLAAVYIELIGGHQAGLDLARGAGAASSGVAELASTLARPEPLASRLSKSEDEAHRLFVSTMGSKALWNIYKD